MNPKKATRAYIFISLIIVLMFCDFYLSNPVFSSKILKSIVTKGIINYSADVTIIPYYENNIGINHLKIGTLFNDDMRIHLKQELRFKISQCNFGIIRLFIHQFEPCIHWYEENSTGIYDWTDLDAILESIYEINAEPFLCIDIEPFRHPEGMYIDPESKLPNKESIHSKILRTCRRY